MNKKERDGFFELYGISEEEEQFFKALYRRRIIYRGIITVQFLALIVLLLLR